MKILYYSSQIDFDPYNHICSELTKEVYWFQICKYRYIYSGYFSIMNNLDDHRISDENFSIFFNLKLFNKILIVFLNPLILLILMFRRFRTDCAVIYFVLFIISRIIINVYLQCYSPYCLQVQLLSCFLPRIQSILCA